MECRTLIITLISADNLPDVRNLFQMKVYAKVSIKGKPKTTQKTPIDLQGETNPRWNFPIEYIISESGVQNPGADLNIKLLCKRSLGDRFIGEVNVSVKGLFEMGFKSEKILSYDVGGTLSGKLNISYSFGEKIWVEKQNGNGGGRRGGGSHGFRVWVRTVGSQVLLDFVNEALSLVIGELIDDDDDDDDDDEDDDEE